MGYSKHHFVVAVCVLCAFAVQAGRATNHGAPSDTGAAEAVLLPDWLGDGFATSATDHFYVAHDAGTGEARQLATRLESAFEHFRLFFNQHGYDLPTPKDKLGWISFTDPDLYSEYTLRADRMDLSRLKGYYSARTNRVVIVGPRTAYMAARPLPEDSLQAQEAEGDIAALAAEETGDKFVKIAHELAHQLAFNTGLQKRGVMYPLWVSEGLATQYETQLSYCRDTNTARSNRLMEMQAAGRLIPLAEFLAVTRLPADRFACEDLYAQAWGFFDFLLKQRPEQLRHYLETLYSIRLGARSPALLRQEFSDSFGSLGAVTKEWAEYLDR